MLSFFLPEGDNSTAFTQDRQGLTLTDTINGLAQKNARMWQIIALVSLACFVFSLVVLSYTASLPKDVPVIVTVNPEGKAAYVGKVSRNQYTNSAIPEIAKEYLIREFITKMHTWVIDRDAQQRYIDETNALVQAGAIRELDSFYRANNPFTNIGDRTRTVDMEPPLKQTERTYIIYFTTTEKNRNGFTLRGIRWSALINIDLFDPSVENPLGIFITNFDIKQIEEQS
jgi:type IV secretory pathway TrbF-like protein